MERRQLEQLRNFHVHLNDQKAVIRKENEAKILYIFQTKTETVITIICFVLLWHSCNILFKSLKLPHIDFRKLNKA